ncbi:LOW QUALITY PROTEIN: uncharacterized protein LOC108158021 [Drosophila miranda]|uniref:LOW QUALITY PROTEIN: uncharacterized protein LOC108158021 n=1 Tax=Drosophila miranda TaxID=7229 RepID=UPI00143F1B0E|nr:LOW QUALITY PROTEIN: uncharacterized protein LOC108158021 [Drosophila miranda]
MNTLLVYEQICGNFEFNNVRCLVRDRVFLDFDYCYLRFVNRTYKYMSLKTKLHKLPITNTVTNFQIRMRENKRILYNFDVRFDACKFLRDRSNVIVNWIFQTFADFSNFNHTCPYHHDIILDKLPVQHINNIIQTVVPDGRYYLNSTWFIDGIPRADVIIYFTKS